VQGVAGGLDGAQVIDVGDADAELDEMQGHGIAI
jgi:hypothetical protein